MAERPSPLNPPPNGNGRHVNWAAARAYFLALPTEHRTFKAVAEKFHVTPARVGQIAKRDSWLKARDELEELEVAETEKVIRKRVLELARDRATRIVRVVELVDRVNDVALQKLKVGEDGAITVEGELELEKILSTMPGLVRMAELVSGEATDRVHVSEVQPVLVAFAQIAVRYAPAEERDRVVVELEQASAGLLQMGPPELVA